MKKGIEKKTIPVIDIFAGPGGLGEGFAAFNEGDINFKIALSIEKDEYAHKTLELRAFYRQFEKGNVPEDYYRYLRQEISRDALFGKAKYKVEVEKARREAWCAELGVTDHSLVKQRIDEALNPYGAGPRILIGGPPCQAYSLVGRSRMKGTDPNEDPRHFLYKHYLEILANHRPEVFIMENVIGILSSKINGEPIFNRILADLSCPGEAVTNPSSNGNYSTILEYTIYSLVQEKSVYEELAPRDFLIRCEEYGIPQTRPRVILLGVRKDIDKGVIPSLIEEDDPVVISEVIGDLPAIRSRLSRRTSDLEDSSQNWMNAICSGIRSKYKDMDRLVMEVVEKNLRAQNPEWSVGAPFIQRESIPNTNEFHKPHKLTSWYIKDDQLKGYCNHEARAHMASDLHRYIFASAYAEVHGTNPRLGDYPAELLPHHKNVKKAIQGSSHFSDRFKVQMRNRPGSTITSHMAKDGHYYIHYDSSQCRSLTVREAARIQTFPDDYFFEGSRSRQYIQVGNAVPPFLAFKIARVVGKLFEVDLFGHDLSEKDTCKELI